MRRVFLTNEALLTEDHPARRPGYRLKFRDKEQLDIKLLQPKTEDWIEVYRPGGALLAVLLKGVISSELQAEAFAQLRTVNGHLDNRPGIVGEKAAQYEVRKADGKMSPRRSVPTVITEKFGGKADMLGYYRYRNPKPGVPKCEMTGWTRRNLGGYRAVLPFIKAVDDVYKTILPDAHQKQMDYVNTIPAKWRIGQTAFTTLYALKNAPTATHTDEFDYPKGFGVMTSLGSFRGGWLCFPRFRLAIDYQPGDLVLADVHQLHANFPIYEGDFRVACVFFCRKGQHECPA